MECQRSGKNELTQSPPLIRLACVVLLARRVARCLIAQVGSQPARRSVTGTVKSIRLSANCAKICISAIWWWWRQNNMASRPVPNTRAFSRSGVHWMLFPKKFNVRVFCNRMFIKPKFTYAFVAMLPVPDVAAASPPPFSGRWLGIRVISLLD